MSADEDLTVLSRGLDQVGDLLDQVPQADPSAPTPCEDWTLTELVAHLAGGPAKFAQMVRGEKPDWSAQPSDEPAAAFRAGAEDLLQSWADVDAAAGPPMGMQFAEIAVHTYDLATALGQPTAALDARIAERGLAFLHDNLTDSMRGAAFAPAQTAPEGADAYQRIAAFAGRTV